METTRLSHLVALRCPFCHDEVADSDVVVCRECLAKHHRACWVELDACSSCRSTEGLVSLKASGPRATQAKPVVAREKSTADRRIVGWVELGAKLAELRQQQERCLFRKPWCLLIPHFWIPFFWPFLLLGLFGEKKRASELAAEVRRVAGVFELELARDHPEALALVEETEGWASRWLF